MNKIKKITILLIFLAISGFVEPCFSFPFEFGRLNETQKEIKEFLNDYNKVLAKNDLKMLSRFYDTEYKNTDGYNLADLLSMIDKTTKTFDDIKYKSKIKRIDTRKNSALVQLEDETTARVYPESGMGFKDKVRYRCKNRDKVGVLDGKSTSIMYLKKQDGAWKILQDSTLSEETTLRYGAARRLNIDLNTPENIENGKDYGLELTLNTPNKVIALASLAREEINSDIKYDDKYRKIKKGHLERVVRANDKNKDEYAIASIGLTKVSLNEKQKKARIRIIGMAYLMKRVNMAEEKVENER